MMSRNKKFDRGVSLDKAMRIFWEQGYGSTSVQDLVDSLGVNRSSLYDTFGDKHDLFIESLQTYQMMVKTTVLTKNKDKQTAELGIKNVFNIFIYHDASQPDGCLIVNSATELAKSDPKVAELIKGYFEEEKNYLRQLLHDHVEELDEQADLDIVAASLQNQLVGVRVLIKSGTPSSQLKMIVDNTVATVPWRK